jgi:hypothetical protein
VLRTLAKDRFVAKTLWTSKRLFWQPSLRSSAKTTSGGWESIFLLIKYCAARHLSYLRSEKDDEHPEARNLLTEA